MPPSHRTHLFVYGTLRRNRSGRLHPLLRGRSRFVGFATTRGRLYNLGTYPALVLDDGDRIQGEVYQLYTPRVTLSLLDRYEGCTPYAIPPEYRREMLRVRLCNGSALQAWGYVYARPVHSKRRITSGDYQRYSGAARSRQQTGRIRSRSP